MRSLSQVVIVSGAALTAFGIFLGCSANPAPAPEETRVVLEEGKLQPKCDGYEEEPCLLDGDDGQWGGGAGGAACQCSGGCKSTGRWFCNYGYLCLEFNSPCTNSTYLNCTSERCRSADE